jgi:hypothetical protein
MLSLAQISVSFLLAFRVGFLFPRLSNGLLSEGRIQANPE